MPNRRCDAIFRFSMFVQFYFWFLFFLFQWIAIFVKGIGLDNEWLMVCRLIKTFVVRVLYGNVPSFVLPSSTSNSMTNCVHWLFNSSPSISLGIQVKHSLTMLELSHKLRTYTSQWTQIEIMRWILSSF